MQESNLHVLGSNLSKTQCVLKCKINANCNTASFIHNKDNEKGGVGTCFSLLGEHNDDAKETIEIIGNIVFEKVHP